MDIVELQRIYAKHPHVKGVAAQLENSSVRTIFMGGLHASASPLFFSTFAFTGFLVAFLEGALLLFSFDFFISSISFCILKTVPLIYSPFLNYFLSRILKFIF